MKYKELIDIYELKYNQKKYPTSEIYKYIINIEDITYSELNNKKEDSINADILDKYIKDLDDLVNGKPIAYVLGYEYFYGLKFNVNSNVLIPRNDTEVLVENTIDIIKNNFNLDNDIVIADIGCGSGAIGISIKNNINSINVIQSDISLDALTITKNNAINNNVSVALMHGDMLKPYIEKNIKLDMIISNPPYIDRGELLDNSVIDYEPELALFAKDNGLYFYDCILKDSNKVLKDNGWIIFEIGYMQNVSIQNLVKKYYDKYEYKCIKDYGGNDRVVIIKIG